MPHSVSDRIQLHAVAGADEHFVTKANAFRGMLTALREDGHFDAVRARVSPEVQAFMDSPPLGISWMPALVFQSVLANAGAVAGLEAVRSVGERSVMHGPLKTWQPVIQSMLRLFGAEPGAFYKRVPSTMEGQLRGVEFEVRDHAQRATEITVTYSYLRDPPLASFVYWQGALSVTFQVCSVRGEASAPVRIESPARNSARIVYSWTK